MSSDKPPEFFLDRSLGKISARRLRDAGHVVHLIAEYYPQDAQQIGDAEWIAEGCRRGWALLTKDRRIRYRTDELSALTRGHLFCLADGNATLDQISRRFLDAMPAILRGVRSTEVGFWHVHGERPHHQDVALSFSANTIARRRDPSSTTRSGQARTWRSGHGRLAG